MRTGNFVRYGNTHLIGEVTDCRDESVHVLWEGINFPLWYMECDQRIGVISRENYLRYKLTGVLDERT